MNSSPPRPRGQRKTQDPCPGCFLHRERCLCSEIPRIETRTKLSLIIHAKEMKRTTNTGILATRALVHSQILVRGRIQEPLDLSSLLDPHFHAVLFYPAPDAIELSADEIQKIGKPIHLIVPDGNWRQASKVHYRHSEIRHLPRVMIKTPNSETKFLRAESTAEGMATLQAIAYAMGVTEGPQVQEELLKLYKLKLDRTLLGRGLRP